MLTRAYPAILGVAAAALALAYGLRLGRSWARPATFVFWVGFIGLLVVVGGREQVSKTLLGTIPVAAASLFYLYFNPSVLAYYADLKRRKAHESELGEWLDRPHSRERGA